MKRMKSALHCVMQSASMFEHRIIEAFNYNNDNANVNLYSVYFLCRTSCNPLHLFRTNVNGHAVYLLLLVKYETGTQPSSI